MLQHAASPLPAWEAFYVITGSSAAALTGLQFVVMTLIADRRRRADLLQISAFGTPTVVHFGAVLLLAAILSAPWPSLSMVEWLVGACGVGGIIYTILILMRARRQSGYQPVLEDWVWHFILPPVAYVTLLVSSFGMRGDPNVPLFATGAAAVLLLFIGIHNAWDTVTFIITEQSAAPAETADARPDSSQH